MMTGPLNVGAADAPEVARSWQRPSEKKRMKTSHAITFLAGVVGGMAMNLAMLITFRFIGFGVNGDGILLNPNFQSRKLIAVWTQLEPLPLVVNQPALIIVGILGFGILHAYLYRWISLCWPPGMANRGLRFAALVFLMTFLFWEFFTPFNQLGEPIALIGVELIFWALIALADGFAISGIMERGVSNQQAEAKR
jgi:hypothetical protein